MKKRYIIIVAFILIVSILSIVFIKAIKNGIYRSKIESGSRELNLDDGLQRDELELLTEDDYHKYEISFMDLENLNLDAVDGFYYSSMLDCPGEYKIQATREEREKIYYFTHNAKEHILELCKKDSDLTSLMYNYQINGYNKHDGLLGDFDYTKIEKVDWVGYSTTDGCMDITVSNDKEERTYRIKIDYYENTTHINVKLGEIKQIDYSKEIELDKVKFDKEHTEENFNYLCLSENAYKGGLEWDYEDIAITDNMYSKYLYFLDLFIHYSPLEYNKITLKDLDIDNQIAIFEVDSRLECKRRTYEVEYILDDNMYLDGVETKILKEVNYEGTSADRENKIFYKNSNWQNLKITDNFINRFAELNSVFPDIDNVSYNFKWTSEYYNQIAKKGVGTIESYRFKDDSTNYYYYKSIYDENKYLDDVICKKLPYDGSMTLEEVLDAFIADKELQKELGIEIS